MHVKYELALISTEDILGRNKKHGCEKILNEEKQTFAIETDLLWYKHRILVKIVTVHVLRGWTAYSGGRTF